MIVKEAMGWAKRNGYSKITLHASPAGRKVYAKLGWKRMGRSGQRDTRYKWVSP